jgi:hypothetical protein
MDHRSDDGEMLDNSWSWLRNGADMVRQAARRAVLTAKQSTLSERVIAGALTGLLVLGVGGGVVMYRESGEVKVTVINSAKDIDGLSEDMDDLRVRFRNHGHPPR